jgi:hypothetical protein
VRSRGSVRSRFKVRRWSGAEEERIEYEEEPKRNLDRGPGEVSLANVEGEVAEFVVSKRGPVICRSQICSGIPERGSVRLLNGLPR